MGRCAVRLEDDYVIFQKVPHQLFGHAEDAPTRLETINRCGAVLFCWLGAWRGLDRPPVLTQAARWPAAVLVEEEDLRKRRDISACITLCETVGKLRIAVPAQSVEQRRKGREAARIPGGPSPARYPLTLIATIRKRGIW